METLRLWPAVANGTFRKLDTDIEIKGKHNKSVLIPKNNIVQIFNWSKHRDKKIWGEDAEIFNPDREFNSNEIWEDNGFAFFNPATPRFSPFTYSPRDCIGKNFAQMEMRLILCNLLKDYHFILTKEQMEYNVLTNSMNNATLAPKDIYNTEKLTNKFRPYNVGMYFYFTHRKSKL
jgi:cytochrome P450